MTKLIFVLNDRINTGERQKKMKCAIYARVSTEEQAKKYSIPAQLELVRNFARMNNYDEFKEYVDEGVSGTISDRPQLRELFRDAERGCFEIVLVYRIDRFFRNTRKLLNAVDDLEKIGIAFKSITEPFDTSSSMGSFMISLLGSVAQLERDTLIERSKMGTLRSVKEGHYMASTPLYGYDYDKETKKLKVNHHEAEIVKLVYRLYQEPFASQKKIAKKLNQSNYPTRKRAKWNTTQIRHILSHPGYYGKWSYGSEHTTIDIPPLIDKQLFDNTRKLREGRRSRPSPRYKHDYLLVRVLYCGMCKRKMGIKRVKRRVKTNNKEYGPYCDKYYYCWGRVLENGCSMRWIRKEDIDLLVWQEIKKYIKNPTLIKRTVKESCRQDQDKLAGLRRELVRIENRIERLELEDDRILGLYRKEIISEEQLAPQIQQTKAEKQILDQRKKEIKLQMESQEYLETRLNELTKLIEKIQGDVDDLDFEGKRRIIELLVNRVFVRQNGRITLELILPSFVSSASTDQS